MTAAAFPGQGAQAVGMGADLMASELAKQADELCGFELSKIMSEGPVEELQKTSVCQVALFLHSALVFEAMKAQKSDLNYEVYLGLSLGEYSALYAAGVLSFEDAMKALITRGRAMQSACESKPGTMATVLGLDDEIVEKVCQEQSQGQVLQAANFNCPGQLVISGEAEAIERAMPVLKEAGAKRVLPLKVAGAFHSELMAPAKEPLRECLESLDFKDGCEKVISNVTATPHDPQSLIDNLVNQLVSSVRFTQSVQYLSSQNVTDFHEIGTGKVLSGLIKRCAPESTQKAFNSAPEPGNL